jgi:hypothetical protein
MPPPSFVLCDLCHQKFSKHSLPIHLKACVAKREASTCFCPVCDNLVSNDEYENHVSECRRVNGPKLAEKKAAAAKAAKAAGKAAPHSAGAAAAAAGAVSGGAAAGGSAAAAPAARSKVPDHVLRKLEGYQRGTSDDTPEQKLAKRLDGATRCDACGGKTAVAACVGCHAVYCNGCSDVIHEVNRALRDHKPVLREVRCPSARRCAHRGSSGGSSSFRVLLVLAPGCMRSRPRVLL